MNPDNINWRQVKRFVVFFLAVIASIILFGQIYQALLVPIGVSLLLTYLLAPVVKKFERYRIPRVFVVSGLLALTLGILTFAFIKIIPALYEEVLELIRMLPQVYDQGMNKWLPYIKETVLSFDVVSPNEFDKIVKESRSFVHISERIQQALTTLWYTAPQVLGTVVNFVMTPLITFFLLKDYRLIRDGLVQVVPRDLLVPVDEFLMRLSATFRAVIKGQATVAAVLAGLYVIGLNIVGLQAAWAIGLIAGACRIIPYLDVIVGGGLALIVVMSAFEGLGQVIGVVSVFLVVQMLDGMLITPRIIGEKVGLHPLVVIVSVIAFGDILGFWGIILAVPIVAVGKVFWLSIRPFYLASVAYDVSNERPLKK